MLSEQTGAGVLLNAKEAEEGEECSTPVARVCEDAEINVRADGAQVVEGEGASRTAEVGITIPIEKTGLDTVEGPTTREVGVTRAHGVVTDSRDETGKAGDAVLVGVEDADATQLEL